MTELHELIPACELLTLSSTGNPVMGRLGVQVSSKNKWPLNPADLEAEVTRRFQERYPGWQAFDEKFQHEGWFSAYDVTLRANGERAGARRGSESKAYLKIAERSLVGTFIRGLAVKADGSVEQLDSRVLLFVWPFERIDNVKLDRRKKSLGGLKDTEVLVGGENGALLRVQDMRFVGDVKPRPELSRMDAFVTLLAGHIAKSRGSEVSWIVEALNMPGLRGESRTADFANSP